MRRMPRVNQEILPRAPACCTEEEEAKGAPFPAVDQATRTEFGRSSIRLRTWAAMATSVARASSLWKRSPSPMTCFQRANWFCQISEAENQSRKLWKSKQDLVLPKMLRPKMLRSGLQPIRLIFSL